ncbi:hypothetical protein [Rummeliibacillus pycnus]|uniref:hypothetical protein n=1 Tax=Rummeliibacillus pycnus TaxID=101070 RepID=UPI0037CB6A23
MELVKPSKVSLLKEQFKLKTKISLGNFMQLAIIEIIMLLLSLFNNVGEFMEDEIGMMRVGLHVSSQFGTFFVSLIWIFAIAIQMPGKEQRKISNSFVSSSTSHVLTDLMLVGIFSFVIAITVLTTNYLSAMILNLFFNRDFIVGYIIGNAPIVFLANLLTMAIVALAVGSFAYVMGVLNQISKLSLTGVAIVLVVIFKGFIISIIERVINATWQISSVILFNVPFLVVAIISIYVACFLSNKLEVKE